MSQALTALSASMPLAAGWSVHTLWMRRRIERARRDPLTGLRTRHGFTPRAIRLVRDDRALVVLADVDDFKAINDTHGHAAGDATLAAVADRLNGWCRNGTAARLGGDEFAGIIRAEYGCADAVLRRVHERLCAPVEWDGHLIDVTVSVGAAQVAPLRLAPAEALSAALRRADEAMYAAKRNGDGWRNRRKQLRPEHGQRSPPRTSGRHLARGGGAVNRSAKVLLVLALVVVVGMAFRVSWNALRDVARTVGADTTAALLYPFVVDGLMALALVATLVLTGPDRTFALRVLAGYTLASLVLNYVHGLVPELHGGNGIQLADWSPANWALVLLATSLPVGSIFFGSDLVAKVLHHRPAATTEPMHAEPERSADEQRERAPEPSAESAPQVADPEPTQSPTPVLTSEPTAPPKPRRTTGPVPPSARTRRPTRTPSELLAEARAKSADWTDAELTADRIRTAVRTSAANARSLRDALKAERAESGRLRLVADADGPALSEAVGSER